MALTKWYKMIMIPKYNYYQWQLDISLLSGQSEQSFLHVGQIWLAELLSDVLLMSAASWKKTCKFPEGDEKPGGC